jgi:hypothetical protein
MSEALKKIEDFKYQLLEDMLAQCTEQQRALFDKMYPEGLRQIPDEKFNWAMQQVERTIEINKKSPCWKNT